MTVTAPSGAAGRERTGPVGRVARLGLAAAGVAALGSLVDARGSARFRNPHVLTEPSAWFLHGLMVVAFILLVGAIAPALGSPRTARTWQVGAAAALAGIVVLAGLVGRLVFGSVWGFPLADLVWWFDVVLLAEEIVAFVLAAILGTPGCEIGVWPQLITRAPGAGTPPALPCIVGLHWLDAWEARRRTSR